MKAIAVRPKKANSVSLIEIEKPRINDGEILIKTISVGIDGTDIEINQGLYGEAPTEEELLVIGHEAVGKVVAVGKGVGNIQVDDFVVPTVRRECGVCINCKNAEPDMCESDDYKERGIVGAHGYLSQYFKENVDNLVKISPDLVPYGSLIEPLSIAQKAVEHIFKIQERFRWRPKTAFVMGAGPLGLLAALILKKKGLDTFSYDIVAEDSPKAKVAKNIGATYINGNKVSLGDLPHVHKERPDLIIEATGNSYVAFWAIDVMIKN
ncbi:MAG: glucose dehydrogenase, partial [Actinobacteria bacterium]